MTKKKKFCAGKIIAATALVGCAAAGTLVTIYVLNLDQKLIAWSYKKVNDVFDRKPADNKR